LFEEGSSDNRKFIAHRSFTSKPWGEFPWECKNIRSVTHLPCGGGGWLMSALEIPCTEVLIRERNLAANKYCYSLVTEGRYIA